MYPILFSIGNLNFYTHGLMVAVGSLIGGGLIYYLARKKNFNTKFLLDLLILSLFVGIIGARITYIIAYYHQFINWTEMLLLWQGGMVSFGGIAFGFIFAFFYLKRKNENPLSWFDIGIISFLFGWGIGRVGCWLTNDTPGLFSVGRLAIFNQIPVALFEASWSIIIGFVLLFLYLKKGRILAMFSSGFYFWLGMFLLMVGRFVIDFWRDDVIVLWVFSFGQIASGLTILAISVYLYLTIRKVRRRKNV